VVRKGAPRNLANAFVKPIWAGHGADLVSASAKALDNYSGKLNKAYGDTAKKAVVLNLTDYTINNLGKEVESFEELIQEIMSEVRAALGV